MPDGDEKETDVNMWSPDKDRNDKVQGIERKSTVEDLQDKLQVALSALDETKGALDAAQKRVSELESSVAQPAEEEKPAPVDCRIETLKAFMAFLVVVAVEVLYFVVILDERAKFGDVSCAGIASVALRSCELCGDGTLVMPVGGDYEKSWPAVWLGLVVGSGGLEVGIICDEFMAAIEKITSSKRSKWITNPAGISSVCISALAHGEVRRIEKYQVFCFTCAASVLAYVWMLVVLAGITPDRVDLAEGVTTLAFFFVFLAIAFFLDKQFSKEGVDPDVAEVHKQLEARFGQSVSLEGVRAMMRTQGKKPPIEARNTKNEAKGQILRLSTGGKKQPSIFAYGFLESEVVCYESDGFASLQIAALNGPHPSPVRIKYRTRNGMAKAGKRYHQKSGVLHFVPEQDKQELRIPLMGARGPPEEFYVELTEIKAEGVDGKKTPPILAQSGGCLVWVISNPEDDGGSPRGHTTVMLSPTSDAGTESKRSHLAAVPSENEPDTSGALSSCRSEGKSEVKSEARSDARSEARSDALQGSEEEDEPFSCSHWMDKAIEAFYCNGSAEEQAQATAFDWLMHCLALTWKIAFMIVPPPSLLGAYPAFFCTLIGIGLATVVINDAASLLGCSVGMADDLTAITLVALGTSLPAPGLQSKFFELSFDFEGTDL
ncbi:Slc8a1 [Symbiodinium pilosum]|uniref:Slc8a1 protein n=1 Tax=Symbiodinium pilosum TaxID=2952 RepID=A0A812TGN9_SYMPI|nr:Slc8a1 [Symbiodinium pilosum]